VVILAIPYSAVNEVVRQLGSQLAGKIVVDITNPMNATYDDLATPPGSSAAEEIAKLAPPNARVVKAFNTTFAGTLVNGAVAGQKLDVFLAGDDADGKKVVAGLVEAGGMRAIDVGSLKRARQLEGLGLLGITLQFTLGTQFKTGWKLIG
jgi:8-hydroxy-5-deazaflavin:NADPH oxidoreductase